MESVSAWALQLGHACLQGSVGIAAVGIVCRVLPRLPAGVRAWLWWLACAKLLLGLWVAAPITLAVLPAPVPVPIASVSAAPPAAAYTLSPRKQTASAATPALPAAGTPRNTVPQAPRWPLLLLTAWLAGVAISLASAVRQALALTKMRRGTVPVLLADSSLDTLARQMGLRRVPRILTGPNIQTPCVAGGLRPAILLPPDFRSLTAGELRLTLAHEMAHLRRGDLLLAVVPLLARMLFFFHPLVWWAAAEWAAAREEACDALALSVTNTPGAEYGRLLLRLASPEAAAPALGVSPGYHHLRRRLLCLASAKQTPRWARLGVLALPLLLPWRLSAALPPAAPQAETPPTRCTVTALSAGTDSTVSGLNDAGQATLSANAQGYIGSGDALTSLSALPKQHASFAYALNNSGQAVGASFNILGHARAFTWDGATHKIGSLPGYPYSEARGISDTGIVAGFAEAGHADRLHAWVSRAFVRQPGGGPLVDLGTLGGPYSAAYAVGSTGIVAGKAGTDSGATHAFLWTEGDGMTDLGTLGGANSAAYAVSRTGEVAGVSETDDNGTRHGFLYVSGQMHDLSPLPALKNGAAYAVNSLSQAVGTSQTASVKRATLWQNGAPTDLNALLPPRSGWVLTEARAINDHGQIAGQGFWNGKPCAFLLTPTTKR